MKKKQLLISACLLLIVVIALCACIKNNKDTSNPSTNSGETQKVRYTTGKIYGYFDTVTTIDGYATSVDEFDKVVHRSRYGFH